MYDPYTIHFREQDGFVDDEVKLERILRALVKHQVRQPCIEDNMWGGARGVTSTTSNTLLSTKP